jgi:hypothetical protein
MRNNAPSQDGIIRASSVCMPYRIDLFRIPAGVTLAFQGVLDEGALADLLARLVAATTPVRLVLRAGTEVDPGCIDALRRLPVAELSAVSPFLTRWLSEDPS